MVLIKHNSLKSNMFFNPIFIPGFSGPWSRVRVQALEVAEKKRGGKECWNLFCLGSKLFPRGRLGVGGNYDHVISLRMQQNIYFVNFRKLLLFTS